jgi:hypothetical protein
MPPRERNTDKVMFSVLPGARSPRYGTERKGQQPLSGRVRVGLERGVRIDHCVKRRMGIYQAHICRLQLPLKSSPTRLNARLSA